MTASTYLDTGRSNGTTYYYVTTALDAASNKSGNSNEAFATPGRTRYHAPCGPNRAHGQRRGHASQPRLE